MTAKRLFSGWVVFGLLLSATSAFGAAGYRIRMVEVSSRQFDYYADNLNFCPYQIQVNIPMMEGYQATETMPYYTVLKTGETNRYLFSLFSAGARNSAPNIVVSSWLGDPAEYHSTEGKLYLFPFRNGENYRITQGYNGGYSHAGWVAYSLDFGLQMSTPVCAARGGIVVAVKEDSSVGGRSRRYRGKANFITVYHPEDGTFSQYHHLKKNGSVVSVGDRVKAGQVIGYSGNTGWSNGPHLHFMAYMPEYKGEQTFPVMFAGPAGEPVEPKSRRYFTSYHVTNQFYAVAKTVPGVSSNGNTNQLLTVSSNYSLETNATGGY